MIKISNLIVVAALCTIGFLAAGVYASPTLSLYEYGANIDGAVSYNPGMAGGDSVPSGMNLSGFDTATGLGTIKFTVSGIGAHYVALYVDHEIDEEINTFYNEYGTAAGTPASGQSWEIDGPIPIFEFVGPSSTYGDIWTNFVAGKLDNTNGVTNNNPDDVSMALAWDLSLAADESANVRMLISDAMPTSGFYLQQTDPDSNYSIYFSSKYEITNGGTTVVPAPGALMLVSIGMASVSWLRKKRVI